MSRARWARGPLKAPGATCWELWVAGAAGKRAAGKPAPVAAVDRSAARDAGKTAESATSAAFAAVLVLKEAAAVVVLVAARFAPTSETLETARGAEPRRRAASSRPHS